MKELLEKYRATYEKLEPAIKENTEKYRKGIFKLRLTDKTGAPLRNADITVTQKSHKFDFGCNGLMLGQLGEKNEIYEQEFAKLFQLVTTTFCWSITETEPGKFRFEEGSEEIFRRPPADRVLKFAQKYGLKAKGQPLLADSWYPKWASREVETLKKQYVNYFAEVAKRYDGKYYMFDVTNESNFCLERTPDFPLLKMGKTEYVKWALKEAQKLFGSKTKLERNEASEVNAGKDADFYFAENKEILAEGIRLDTIGLQFHFFNEGAAKHHLNNEYLALEEIYGKYLKYCELGIPMYISEVTIPSRFSGLTREQGEQIQAEMIEKLYRLWFSVPNMAGIIYWNFKDGPAWNDEGDCLGCLLDTALREKPSYQVLYQLIRREWNTELTLKTDEKGEASFRGYYGTYDILVDGESCEVDFIGEGQEDIMIEA